MNRILTVAQSEFLSLIRTKAFIIGILLVPVLMTLFITFMNYAEDHVDTTDRRIAVIDETGVLWEPLQRAAVEHNTEAGEGADKTEPHFLLERVESGPRTKDDVAVELSQRVKAKELFAFVELPKDILVAREPEASTAARRRAARREGTAAEDAEDGPTFKFYAETTSARPVTRWLEDAVNQAVAEHRFTTAGIDQTLVKKLTSYVTFTPYGLFERSADGTAAPAKEMDEVARVGLPMFALVLMFMGVMTGAMHLLNAIIEEKMSKISEVLLGSVSPFQLLAGKLVGVVGVSLLLTLVYLVGGIYALLSFGRLDLIDPLLIFWFLVFMICAALMFGSIFLAIGSACSDLKDSQSMVQPAMMLIILAYLASFVVMRAPESGLAVGLSMFPTITPFAMMLRLVMPPGPPLWQVLVSVALLIAATGAVVWAAGRIFRVGLLMQGKPPNIPELLKWIRL
jgi:ABC-2 type transport system permease protein